MKTQKIRIKIDREQIVASVSAALMAQFEGEGNELELEITEELLKDNVQLAMGQQIREVLDRQRMTIRHAIEALIADNLGALITPDVVKKHVQAYAADQVRYDLPRGAKAQIKAHIAKLFMPGVDK